MFNFQPASIPSRIFVVGCGGTGSRVVPLLAQFIRSITREFNPRGWLNSTQIVLIDGDVVEQKNLLRQNFIAQDVGKNKAAVIAGRYAKAYGVNIVAYPEFIKEEDTGAHIRKNIPGYTANNYSDEMVIMCVDSANARRMILSKLTPQNYDLKTVYIDAGNEDSFGQVKFFTSDIVYSPLKHPALKDLFKNPERIEHTGVVNFVPYDPAYYENLQDNPGLGSCADLDQTLAINAIMATLIIGIVQNYYYSKPMNYNEVSIDLKGSAAFTYNTVSNFRNKAITPDSKLFNSIQRSNMGLLSTVSMQELGFLEAYKRENEIAVAKVLAEQAEASAMPSLTAKLDEPKKKRSKKLAEESDALVEAASPNRGFSALRVAEAIIANPVTISPTAIPWPNRAPVDFNENEFVEVVEEYNDRQYPDSGEL